MIAGEQVCRLTPIGPSHRFRTLPRNARRIRYLRPGVNKPSRYIMLARYYGSGSTLRFLSVDPGEDTDMYLPQSWNKYAYVRNNPIAYNDPDGQVLNYTGSTQQEREEAKAMTEAAAAVSPDVKATLDHFSDPATTEYLNIGIGDAPDPPGEIRVGQTDSDYGKQSGNYKGSTVTIDKKDIESTEGTKGQQTDPRTVVIHEVVGHVNQDRQKTLQQQKQVTDKKREKVAKRLTKRELNKIPKDKRPKPIPKKLVPKKKGTS